VRSSTRFFAFDFFILIRKEIDPIIVSDKYIFEAEVNLSLFQTRVLFDFRRVRLISVDLIMVLLYLLQEADLLGDLSPLCRSISVDVIEK
jgi:hypothetical protein